VNFLGLKAQPQVAFPEHALLSGAARRVAVRHVGAAGKLWVLPSKWVLRDAGPQHGELSRSRSPLGLCLSLRFAFCFGLEGAFRNVVPGKPK